MKADSSAGLLILVAGMVVLGALASVAIVGKNANSAFGIVAGNAMVGLAGQAKQQAALVPLKRKIVYTAEVQLIVENIDTARHKLEQLVNEDSDIFISHEDWGDAVGSRRSGHWTVRVPAEKLKPFLAAIVKLGDLQRNKLDAQDVTEEFYDVQADLENKKVEREAWLSLEKSATKEETLINAKREVYRVQGEMDRLKKRLETLDNLTTLSTVTLYMSEREYYVDEQGPGLGTSISRTFSGSIQALLSFGKFLLLATVAAAPWLVLLALIGTPLALVLRRRARSRAAAIPAEVAPPAVTPQ